MQPKDKDFEMKRFAQRKPNSVATIIEVGVNVPNTLMMVMKMLSVLASQLHQLRGRIGRGSAKSYVVNPNEISEVAQRRMQIMTASQDGFRIARRPSHPRSGDIAEQNKVATRL